jgi:hypothetical protein
MSGARGYSSPPQNCGCNVDHLPLLPLFLKEWLAAAGYWHTNRCWWGGFSRFACCRAARLLLLLLPVPMEAPVLACMALRSA